MIIECPQCHIHYEVGDTLPPEGMNVRCAECHEVWLAKPIDIDLAPPALHTNDNTSDAGSDIVSPAQATDSSDSANGLESPNGADSAVGFDSPNGLDSPHGSNGSNSPAISDSLDSLDSPDSSDSKITSGASQPVTTEDDNAKVEETPLAAFSSDNFQPAELVDEVKSIRQDPLFDEVHDEIYVNDINMSSDLDNRFEPAVQNGAANGNLSAPITANGHNINPELSDLNPERSDPTSVGTEIDKEIASIAVDKLEQPASRRRMPGLAFFSWVTVFAVIAGVGLSAFMMPNRVARKFPVTVGFYDALGIDINSRGLVIQDVKYEHTSNDGRPALLLSGNVLNVTDETLKIPTVVAELRDKDGLILFVWATEVKVDSLEPKKTASFSATIPAPTDLVRQVKLRFSTRP